ncbi:MAG: LemA family protein [Phycisphaerae bacterium]|jgi:LemA protein
MNRRAGVAAIVLAFIVVLAVFALVIGGCAVSGYNKAINLSERVDAQWAQVDVVLQRRYDLIPNLMETVKGYAGHEKEIFTEIAKSREKYFQAGGRDEKVAAANGLERALSRLLVLQERYPDLKAQASFQQFMDSLEGTENRISVERRRYNLAVKELNLFCRGFFGQMYSGWAGVTSAEYFEAEQGAKEAPKVDFGSGQSP